jgi:hypothetical protein
MNPHVCFAKYELGILSRSSLPIKHSGAGSQVPGTWHRIDAEGQIPRTKPGDRLSKNAHTRFARHKMLLTLLTISLAKEGATQDV